MHKGFCWSYGNKKKVLYIEWTHLSTPKLPMHDIVHNLHFSIAEDMCHIDDIPKITGVLEEFIPGKNGCEVFKK